MMPTKYQHDLDTLITRELIDLRSPFSFDRTAIGDVINFTVFKEGIEIGRMTITPSTMGIPYNNTAISGDHSPEVLARAQDFTNIYQRILGAFEWNARTQIEAERIKINLRPLAPKEPFNGSQSEFESAASVIASRLNREFGGVIFWKRAGLDDDPVIWQFAPPLPDEWIEANINNGGILLMLTHPYTHRLQRAQANGLNDVGWITFQLTAHGRSMLVVEAHPDDLDALDKWWDRIRDEFVKDGWLDKPHVIDSEVREGLIGNAPKSSQAIHGIWSLPILFDILDGATARCIEGYAPGAIQAKRIVTTFGSVTYELYNDDLGKMSSVELRKTSDDETWLTVNEPPSPAPTRVTGETIQKDLSRDERVKALLALSGKAREEDEAVYQAIKAHHNMVIQAYFDCLSNAGIGFVNPFAAQPETIHKWISMGADYYDTYNGRLREFIEEVKQFARVDWSWIFFVQRSGSTNEHDVVPIDQFVLESSAKHAMIWFGSKLLQERGAIIALQKTLKQVSLNIHAQGDLHAGWTALRKHIVLRLVAEDATTRQLQAVREQEMWHEASANMPRLTEQMTPPKQYTKLRVFIASPGDVPAERGRLASTVESLNRVFTSAVGVELELKEWSQVVPDMGRPQQVIFNHLNPTEWDIFIGILWLRYGSKSGGPNPDESGTHEEFNLAYDLWKQHGRPRIMFYRCTRPPADVTQINTNDLVKINAFFDQFERGGKHPGLYRKYETPEEFERLVREHLEQILIQYSEQVKHTPIREAIKLEVTPQIAFPSELQTTSFLGREKNEEWVKRLADGFEPIIFDESVADHFFGDPNAPHGKVLLDDIERIPFSLVLSNEGHRTIELHPNRAEKRKVAEIRPADVSNISAIHVLLSAGDTRRMRGQERFVGQSIGEFIIYSGDIEPLRVPLRLGIEIREWSSNDPDWDVVTTATRAKEVWRSPNGSKTLDMLRIDLPDPPRHITKLEVVAECPWLPNTYSDNWPSVRISGVTYRFAQSAVKDKF